MSKEPSKLAVDVAAELSCLFGKGIWYNPQASRIAQSAIDYACAEKDTEIAKLTKRIAELEVYLRIG